MLPPTYQLLPTCHYKYYKWLFQWYFNLLSSCFCPTDVLLPGALGKWDTAQDLVREVARSGVFLGASSPTDRPWQLFGAPNGETTGALANPGPVSWIVGKNMQNESRRLLNLFGSIWDGGKSGEESRVCTTPCLSLKSICPRLHSHGSMIKCQKHCQMYQLCPFLAQTSR